MYIEAKIPHELVFPTCHQHEALKPKQVLLVIVMDGNGPDCHYGSIGVVWLKHRVIGDVILRPLAQAKD